MKNIIRIRPLTGFLGLLLLIFAAGGISAADLVVSFSAAGPDVFRVTVSARAADEAPAPCRSQNTEMRFEDGMLLVERTDIPEAELLWSGRLIGLQAYGRANVPGTRLEWKAHPGEAIYGLGQRFNALNQAGKMVEMWNRDAPGQGRENEASYFCTPVLFSSAGYAFFAADNPDGAFSLNPLGEGLNRYSRAGQEWTFYLAFARTVKELVLQRARLQGPFRGIPDWAWGPWISRNSYENQNEAEEAIKGMAERGFPVAAIVQEAWKGPYETGDFNNFVKDRWPDLDRYFALCSQHDIRTVLWQVPVIPPSHPGLDEMAAKNYFVKNPDGAVSWRREWLEGMANIDFTNPEAVKWWKDQMRDEVRMGVRGFKADDGEDIKPDDVFADGRHGWQLHNDYAALYAYALYELFDEEGADGMLWGRSASLGTERTPALWAGDQFASWEQYRSLLPAGLSAGLSGAPFWGHDIGGYIGDPGPELYIRWLQFGAFSPLMQYHGVQRREPWEFGPEAEAAYRLLSHLRMNLKPALIELGREAAETGLPVMRPMIMEFPDDPRFSSEDSQYMLGPNLLVAPILEAGATARRVKFPAGRWRHLLRPDVFEGPAETSVVCGLVDAPVFVREGASLKVQLAEGAKLGVWTLDAPVREIVIGPPLSAEAE
ncbi:MAG TPA: glycoside hydrolase family 31 protein [Kiritimatiellia bacterium]|nr:glycoside hydrolase family 31 protein [Kiritimatiellia bacterium]HNS80896.1 glycoside hydrolase family 31 protein [Kiritimatiellia bacterium]HPA77297.1 glycoside hydrolase family 31 protein [Kiritimatiellia bacterium]HQQ04096.1 glycoside hydrolase family 31 protein [Kiritimatiellia bacterium]